jgi:predicted permease
MAAITLAGIGGPEALSDDLLIIEAASAPATALILMARTYGGNLDRIGAVILISYGLCPVFLPLWLGAWNLF